VNFVTDRLCELSNFEPIELIERLANCEQQSSSNCCWMRPAFVQGAVMNGARTQMSECIAGCRDGAPVNITVDSFDSPELVDLIIASYRLGHIAMPTFVCDWEHLMLSRGTVYDTLLSELDGAVIFGVICTLDATTDLTITLEPLVVNTDMHIKAVTVGSEHAFIGSFNMNFDHTYWRHNWETGAYIKHAAIVDYVNTVTARMLFGHSEVRIAKFDNLELCYSFSAYQRPHLLIFEAMQSARSSIRICIFTFETLNFAAWFTLDDLLCRRMKENAGLRVEILVNGHMSRIRPNMGSRSKHFSLEKPDMCFSLEQSYPVYKPLQRLADAGASIFCVYGDSESESYYSPIHCKFCIIDDECVLDGSYNFYNTSKYSHEMYMKITDAFMAACYRSYWNDVRTKLRCIPVTTSQSVIQKKIK